MTTKAGHLQNFPVMLCFITLQGYLLHIPTFKWWSTTRAKQPNLLEKHLLRNWCKTRTFEQSF